MKLFKNEYESNFMFEIRIYNDDDLLNILNFEREIEIIDIDNVIKYYEIDVNFDQNKLDFLNDIKNDVIVSLRFDSEFDLFVCNENENYNKKLIKRLENENRDN